MRSGLGQRNGGDSLAERGQSADRSERPTASQPSARGDRVSPMETTLIQPVVQSFNLSGHGPADRSRSVVDVAGRALQHIESLRQSAEEAAADAEEHRVACERLREQLYEGNSTLRHERDMLVQELAKMKRAAEIAAAKARQSESEESLARLTRDQAFKQACHAGGKYAALRAETAWLKKLIAAMPDVVKERPKVLKCLKCQQPLAVDALYCSKCGSKRPQEGDVDGDGAKQKNMANVIGLHAGGSRRSQCQTDGSTAKPQHEIT